ncbi:MAG: galactokinase family protein, partial [Ilumatobacteraceae bacterium]
MAARPLTGRRATWSAPGRVNLIGEHTDYNDGLALPFAIPMRTTVHGVAREDTSVRVSSTGRDPIEFGTSATPGTVIGWGAYVAGVVWAMSSAGHRVPGVDLEITSEVPVGAGLSSSAALECAVALTVADIAALALGAEDIVTIARR